VILVVEESSAGVAVGGCGAMAPGARRTKTITGGKGSAAVWLPRVASG